MVRVKQFNVKINQPIKGDDLKRKRRTRKEIIKLKHENEEVNDEAVYGESVKSEPTEEKMEVVSTDVRNLYLIVKFVQNT